MPFDPYINDGGRSYRPGEEEWNAKFVADRNSAEAARLASLGTANDDNNNSGTPNTSAQSLDKVTISPTSMSGQKTGKNLVDQNFPGKRKDNPLSNFSSYTYSLTLYMVTPEFMNEFINGASAGTLPANRRNTNQIFVVAQSGGVNDGVDSRALTFSKALGPNQQGLDLYIDDLSWTTTLPGGQNGQTTATEGRFKIIEPNGFSFLQDLTIASNRLNGISSILKSSTTKPLALDQKYILSIRYYGYDVSGNLIQSKSPNGNFSDSSSVSERHLPIKISSVKFKLDEKSTIYTVEALHESEQAAFSKSKGIVEQQTTVSGNTIEDVLLGTSKGTVGLLQVINGVNQDKKDRNKIVDLTNEYAIEFIGKNNPIAKSKLIDDKEFESRISKMTSVSTTEQSNISASFKAVTTNVKDRNLSIAAGTSILQAIDNIIVKSDFITSTLNQVNTGNPETKTVTNASKRPLQWYSINPVVTVKGIDKKTNTWAYKITYQIGVYDIPYARTPYASVKVKYPGPYKYYGYFLTGENTEILEYEQTYDNLYTITATKGTGPSTIPETEVKKTSVPIVAQPSNSNSVGGKIFNGSEINESVRAVLYSPSDRSMAKITILGDPDYIMSVVGVNQNVTATASNSAERIYGPDNSINPYRGQVFIQVMFNTVSDYQTNGLMDVSDKIQFYATKDVSDAGIKGIVYKVNFVESTFSKGKFTQLLDCVIVESNQLITSDKTTEERTTTNTNTAAGSGRPTSQNAQTNNSGNARSDESSEGDVLLDRSLYLESESRNRQAISEVMNYESALPTPNDDQITVATRQIETGGIIEDTAREVFGEDSVEVFGTTGGGAAMSINRKAARGQRIRNQQL